MKTIAIIVLAWIFVCCHEKPKETTKKEVLLTFNGFPIGTPADSIEYRVGFKPYSRDANEIKYKDVTFEEYRGDIGYKIAGGRLVGASFIQTDNDTSGAKNIHNSFLGKFGNPIKETSEAAIWRIKKTEIYLTKNNPAAVFFIRTEK